MRGIKFQIPNEYDNFLFRILNGTDIENYFWIISESEVYTVQLNELFPIMKLDGKEFLQRISQEIYYLISVKILASCSTTNEENVTNYSEFSKSNYDLIIFISDNIFVEIYSKYQTVLDQIKRNAEVCRFFPISDITDANDFRTQF